MTGQTILHYRVVEKIGAGGMGEIYKAQDDRLNRVVAVKVLSPRLAAEPERRKRFFQEARAASSLNHPNIITLYDIISEGDLQCIVMEFVAGKTLREVIPHGGLGAQLALQYAMQMASALSAAHTAGLIHRDLKPSNVMITSSGLVKILDFGLAKWIDPNLGGQNADGSTIDQAVTTEGSIVGTVSYMSPEQAVGKRVDTRSDIFSFGSVMYEMVTGRRAFEGSSGISTLSSILRDDVKPIYELAPGVPPLFDQIILRCLPKEPDARWQSMKEIEGALAALQRQLDRSMLNDAMAPTAAGAAPPVAPSSAGPPTPPPPVSTMPPPPATAAETPKPVGGKPAASKPAASPPPPAGTPSKSPALVWGSVGVLLIAGAVAGGWWLWQRSQNAPPAETVQVTQPPEATPPPAPAAPPAAAEPAPPSEPTPAPATEPVPTAASKNAAPKKTTPKAAPPAGKAATQQAVPSKAPAETQAPSTAASAPQSVPEPAPSARSQAASVAVSVSDALPFRIVLAEDVPVDVEQAKTVRFTVVDGLRVGENVVIAKGASVTGAVAREASKKKFLAFGGSKTMFELHQVDAVDGKKLSVRALAGRPSDGIAIRPFDTGKGSKSKTLAASQGTEYVGYIDGAQSVSVSK